MEEKSEKWESEWEKGVMTTLLNKIGPKRTDLDGKVIETEY